MILRNKQLNKIISIGNEFRVALNSTTNDRSGSIIIGSGSGQNNFRLHNLNITTFITTGLNRKFQSFQSIPFRVYINNDAEFTERNYFAAQVGVSGDTDLDPVGLGGETLGKIHWIRSNQQNYLDYAHFEMASDLRIDFDAIITAPAVANRYLIIQYQAELEVLNYETNPLQLDVHLLENP